MKIKIVTSIIYLVLKKLLSSVTGICFLKYVVKKKPDKDSKHKDVDKEFSEMCLYRFSSKKLVMCDFFVNEVYYLWCKNFKIS